MTDQALARLINTISATLAARSSGCSRVMRTGLATVSTTNRASSKPGSNQIGWIAKRSGSTSCSATACTGLRVGRRGRGFWFVRHPGILGCRSRGRSPWASQRDVWELSSVASGFSIRRLWHSVVDRFRIDFDYARHVSDVRDRRGECS
jgi:hypothetical protein